MPCYPRINCYFPGPGNHLPHSIDESLSNSILNWKKPHSPAAFGKVMSEVKPRMAVAYHALLIPELLQDITETIRTTYDGPLTIASDLFVWDVTKDKITVREAVVADRVYPPPAGPEWGKAERTGSAEISPEIKKGWWEEYDPPPLPEK